MPVDRYVSEADREARHAAQRPAEPAGSGSEASLTEPVAHLSGPASYARLQGRANQPVLSAALLGAQRATGNRATGRLLQRMKDTTETAGTSAPTRSGPVVIQRCPSCGNPECSAGEQCGATAGPAKKGGAQYALGQHGAKGREQKRLGEMFGISVSGETHESEHAIGFEVLNRTSGLKRGTAGRAKELENRAPAYQEVKALHRGHIGTGMHGTADESGFNSEQYRDAQRELTTSGRAGDAVQLNQLGYAFSPSFRGSAGTREGQAATESYNTMVKGMGGVTYAEGAADKTVSVPPEQQAEMWLARMVAQGQGDPSRGGWPTDDQIKQAYDLFNVKKS